MNKILASAISIALFASVNINAANNKQLILENLADIREVQEVQSEGFFPEEIASPKLTQEEPLLKRTESFTTLPKKATRDFDNDEKSSISKYLIPALAASGIIVSVALLADLAQRGKDSMLGRLYLWITKEKTNLTTAISNN